MLTPSQIFDEIMQNIDPDEIPIEYISFAKVTDNMGRSRMVKGPESLTRVLRGPERKKLVEAQVMLNERKIRIDIVQGVDDIYAAVSEMIEAAAESSDDKNTDN